MCRVYICFYKKRSNHFPERLYLHLSTSNGQVAQFLHTFFSIWCCQCLILLWWEATVALVCTPVMAKHIWKDVLCVRSLVKCVLWIWLAFKAVWVLLWLCCFYCWVWEGKHLCQMLALPQKIYVWTTVSEFRHVVKENRLRYLCLKLLCFGIVVFWEINNNSDWMVQGK